MAEDVTYLKWTITGEFITRMARTWVLERRWDDAIRWLKDSLMDIEYDHIMAILAGKAKVIGDSNTGIFLEDEDLDDTETKKYVRDYMFLYGGIYTRYENHYQPYAVVRDFGPADVHLGNEPRHKRESRFYHQNRAMYYAHTPATDTCFSLRYTKIAGPSRMWILWKRVDKPPLWIKTYHEPQEALDEYIQYHNLEVTGYSTLYPAGTFTAPSTWLKGRLDKDKQEQLEADADARYRRRVEEIREEIFNKTTEWIVLTTKEGEQYQVPKAPFEQWALSRTEYRHPSTWTSISPRDFKMVNDDPLHTDWVIGAGIMPDEIYDDKYRSLVTAAYGEMLRIQQRVRNIPALGKPCAVLNGTGTVSGVAVWPCRNQEVALGSIIIIPEAGPEYYVAMVSACRNGTGAVITETGGKLCHLATQAWELGARIVQVENALMEFSAGTFLTVNCDEGVIIRGTPSEESL